jgi:hypothetical protein
MSMILESPIGMKCIIVKFRVANIFHIMRIPCGN